MAESDKAEEPLTANESINAVIVKNANERKKTRHFSKYLPFETSFNSTLLRQELANASFFLSIISSGMVLSLTGMLLPQIREQIGDGEPWLVATLTLFTPIGILASGFVMRKYGRRRSFVYSGLPFAISWIYVSICEEFWQFMIGFTVISLLTEINSSVAVVYAAEIPEANLRGFFALLNFGIGFNGGLLLGHLFGVVFSWQIAFRLSSLIAFVSFFISLRIPESPNWLIFRRRPEKATRVFYKLRAKTIENENELEEMLTKQTAEMNATEDKNFTKTIVSRIFLKPFLISMVAVIVMVGCGDDLISFFAIDILSNLTNNVETEKTVLIVDSIRLLAGLTSCYFMKKIKHRKLYFVSVGVILVSLLCLILGIIFKFTSTVLIIFLSSYIGFTSLGLTPVSWSLVVEIFPQIVRDTGYTASMIFYCLISFVFVELCPVIINELGSFALYALFAVVIFIGSVLLYFFMPETKNRTLQQVENFIRNESK